MADITGTAGDDVLVGTPDDDLIEGLAGDDQLEGAGGNDELRGGDDEDILDGGTGDDLLIGGDGNDTYYLDSPNDRIEEVIFGFNQAYTSVSYSFYLRPANIQYFAALDPDGTDPLNLTGSHIAQEIVGNAGNNVIHGGGSTSAGFDRLRGLGGNDTYYNDHIFTQVFEEVGGGYDAFYTSGNFVLNPGAEVEVLSTNSHASTTPANLTGNEFDQTIVGNAGRNSLEGGGGADVLVGLGGDDTYRVGQASVQVHEAVGGGLDTILTRGNYTLGGNAEIESLLTEGFAATGGVILIGNRFNQTIEGKSGNDVLHSGGGYDLLIGYGGNDIYYTDVFATTVREAVGGGSDMIYTSVGFVLAAGVEVELLSTNSHAGTAAINLGGNELANTLLGNAGANILNGGGAGDLMHGFGGSDVYYVDHASDLVFEAAGGGSDAVYASASYTLTASQHIEGLAATNRAGTGAINLTGNALANSVGGNAGANVLNGGGGNDFLYGLGSADTFAFTTPVGPGNPSNVDVLSDFSVADDTIALENDVFVGLPIGALNPNAFHTGATAQDADDRIIYNSATGQLLFDADGSGGGAVVLFASLGAGLGLTASDFVVI